MFHCEIVVGTLTYTVTVCWTFGRAQACHNTIHISNNHTLDWTLDSMDDSGGSTSPDPLILPSSPLLRSSPRRQSVVPNKLRFSSPNKQHFSSPSKSFVMDMEPGKNGDNSPWRIKVTVEAEPKDGESPSKRPRTKTTTVPLKLGSSSPAKRPQRRAKSRLAHVEESEMEVEIKRPQRKRKGTPMRRVAKRPTPEKVIEEEE